MNKKSVTKELQLKKQNNWQYITKTYYNQNTDWKRHTAYVKTWLIPTKHRTNGSYWCGRISNISNYRNRLIIKNENLQLKQTFQTKHEMSYTVLNMKYQHKKEHAFIKSGELQDSLISGYASALNPCFVFYSFSLSVLYCRIKYLSIPQS